jgi:hypothetical protein
MRKVIDKDLVGKTIKAIENESINVLCLKFTDGTEIKLWAEQAVATKSGMIPGIFVSDSGQYDG